MKYFLLLTVFALGVSNSFAAANTEDQLLTNFSDAAKSKNVAKKCKATQDLLNFYVKTGDRNKAAMADGILKRDCKKSK